MALGDLVANQRKRLQLSQEQLGKLAGVSREQVSKIENNRAQHPDWDDLRNIAQALGLTPATVLAEAGYQIEAPSPTPAKTMVSILRQALAIAEELEQRGLGIGDYSDDTTQKKTTVYNPLSNYSFVK